jgi:hypothetical protein
MTFRERKRQSTARDRERPVNRDIPGRFRSGRGHHHRVTRCRPSSQRVGLDLIGGLRAGPVAVLLGRSPCM